MTVEGGERVLGCNYTQRVSVYDIKQVSGRLAASVYMERAWVTLRLCSTPIILMREEVGRGQGMDVGGGCK